MQSIIEGIDQLPAILKAIGCCHPFMVTDTSFSFLNIKEKVENLAVNGVYFNQFKPNPLYEDVLNGINLYKQENCDAIIAVGGGSAIDIAKCIKLAILATQGSLALIPPIVKEQIEIDGELIPFIAIPTTAGTGSESTHNAVIYYQGAKQTVTNDGILPHYAILEPTVLATLPLYQKKCTMLDALCQGIESWWSVNSTPESREYSKVAVELIIKNWHNYIFDHDAQSAKKIMLAANYAGRAINISATTAAHAMSYKLTSLYGLPHGHAVAVCLPKIWEYMIHHTHKCIDKRGQTYMTNIFNSIAVCMGVDNADNAITLFYNILHKLSINNPAWGDRESELQLLTDSVNPIRLKNNPVELESMVLKELYSTIVTR